MQKQPNWQQAFTLVELLVTVAIIALLLGILVPTLSSARAQSKLAVCRVNLKSIAEHVAAYAQENENRIPRGPSHLIGVPPNNNLPSPYIATTRVWLATGYQDNNEVDRPPQYIGIGLTRKMPGKDGNEFFFCPGDDRNELEEEAVKIGIPGDDPWGDSAYSSYFYRQLDMLQPTVSGEYDQPERQGPGRLDMLDYNTFEATPEKTVRVDVHALALDRNSPDPFGGVRQQTNHAGKKVNVAYVDGSTNSFENERYKLIEPDGTIKIAPDAVPWANLPVLPEQFGGPPNNDYRGMMGELDRIFMTADFSYLQDDPTFAPRMPLFPPY